WKYANDSYCAVVLRAVRRPAARQQVAASIGQYTSNRSGIESHAHRRGGFESRRFEPRDFGTFHGRYAQRRDIAGGLRRSGGRSARFATSSSVGTDSRGGI